MSVIKLFFLWCDYPDCGEEFGPESTAAIARRNAVCRAGWMRASGRDYCPVHHPDEATK